MTVPASAVAELLTLTVTIGGGALRVAATGEIDAFTAPQLVTAIDEALDTVPVVGAVQLTIDLQAVTFLDSSGVHALAGAYRRAATAGVLLTVYASGPAVLRPLQVSGLWPLIAGPDSAAATVTPTGDAA